jgi:hypothetical protein
MMDSVLLEKIRKYSELLDDKARLRGETTENNKAIEACRDELAKMMLDSEVPKITTGGYSYSLRDVTKYSKKAEAEDALFDALRANDLGDLIKETVNAQTLQGAMSDLAEENDGALPPDFTELVNVYNYYDVSRRKATAKE